MRIRCANFEIAYYLFVNEKFHCIGVKVDKMFETALKNFLNVKRINVTLDGLYCAWKLKGQFLLN